MKDKVIIIGAGGHSKVVYSTLTANSYNVIAFYDDAKDKIGKKLFKVPILGPIKSINKKKAKFIIAIGDNRIRKKIAESYRLSYIKLIHPLSYLDKSSEIRDGTIIFAGAIVQPDCKIGKHCIINTSASIDHDCIIEDYVHVGPGARICGGCSIGEGTLIGVGASVIPGIKIGKWCIVGAGTPVVKNLPDNSILIGNKPKIVKKSE